MMGWPGLKKDFVLCSGWCVCVRVVVIALSPFSYFEKKKVDGF